MDGKFWSAFVVKGVALAWKGLEPIEVKYNKAAIWPPSSSVLSTRFAGSTNCCCPPQQPWDLVFFQGKNAATCICRQNEFIRRLRAMGETPIDVHVQRALNLMSYGPHLLYQTYNHHQSESHFSSP